MARKINLATLAADDVSDSEPRHVSGVAELPIDNVAPNPLNQRAEGDEDADEFQELVETIKRHGVLQPLVVCSVAAFVERFPDEKDAVDDARWVALIGNRRLLAAREANRQLLGDGKVGLPQLPAVLNDERAGSMFEVMLIENSHRRDLAPLREAEAMRQVVDRDDVSQAELARRIGRTAAYVTQRLNLLKLIPALRTALEAGVLPVTRARELALEDIAVQEAAVMAGPPDWDPSRLNRVNAPRKRSIGRRSAIPVGDPAAAARSIREFYTGEELVELIRLLSTEDV